MFVDPLSSSLVDEKSKNCWPGLRRQDLDSGHGHLSQPGQSASRSVDYDNLAPVSAPHHNESKLYFKSVLCNEWLRQAPFLGFESFPGGNDPKYRVRTAADISHARVPPPKETAYANERTQVCAPPFKQLFASRPYLPSRFPFFFSGVDTVHFAYSRASRGWSPYSVYLTVCAPVIPSSEVAADQSLT